MRVTIHQPQYLPWLGYLDKIDQADLFIALDSVQFKKNEWQNRNRIRTADGCQWVTVPVLHRFGQLVKDVRINQTVNWRSQHVHAIEMQYARAPFRDRYLPELRSLYARPWERLHELNMAVIRWLLGAYRNYDGRSLRVGVGGARRAHGPLDRSLSCRWAHRDISPVRAGSSIWMLDDLNRPD